jgi:hypothetical protein
MDSVQEPREHDTHLLALLSAYFSKLLPSRSASKLDQIGAVCKSSDRGIWRFPPWGPALVQFTLSHHRHRKERRATLAKHEHLLILLQLPEMVVHGLNAIPNMLEDWCPTRTWQSDAYLPV